MDFAFIQSKMRLFIREQDGLQRAQTCFSFLVAKKPPKNLTGCRSVAECRMPSHWAQFCAGVGQIKGRNPGRAPRDKLPMGDAWGSHCCWELPALSFFPMQSEKAGPALGNLSCHLEGLNLGFCFASGLLFHALLSVCSPSECYSTGMLCSVKC